MVFFNHEEFTKKTKARSVGEITRGLWRRPSMVEKKGL